MKRIMVVAAILLSFSGMLFAQTAPKDSVVFGWKHSLVTNVNLSQVSFKNWAQGGENSLAYTGSLAGKSVQEMPMTSWVTQYTFAYGEARLGNLGTRKTDDKIDLSTVLTYKVGVYVNPYASATFSSQFTTGYTYTDTSKTAVSGFLDPAYAMQTVGLGYQPIPEFKTRLGVGLRETFTHLYTKYTDDPTTPGVEKLETEGGLESVTELAVPIDSVVFLTSKLQLFSPFKTLDKIIVHFDNALNAKISKYFSTSFVLQMINDHVITPRTQIREGLSIGITYILF